MTPVCIAGMHRSGTSMVAGLLHVQGLYLGEPSDLMPPTPDNPEGFWEHLQFVGINEEILETLGTGWDLAFQAAAGWERSGALSRVRSKAQRLIDHCGGNGPWGWKDPRNSFTLPFWLSLLPQLKLVVCLRNPLEVAFSLKRRNSFSYAHSLVLWAAYNRSLLAASRPEQRIVTHYDAYFSQAEQELGRILGWLGLDFSGQESAPSHPGPSPQLRHHRVCVHQLADAGVSDDVQDLYRQMCAEAGWTDDGRGRRLSSSEIAEQRGRQSAPEDWDPPVPEHRQGLSAGAVEGPAGQVSLGSAVPVGVERLSTAAIELESRRQEAATLRCELAGQDATGRKLARQLDEAVQALQHAAQARGAQNEVIGRLQAQAASWKAQYEALQRQPAAPKAVDVERQLTAIERRLGRIAKRQKQLQAVLEQRESAGYEDGKRQAPSERASGHEGDYRRVVLRIQQIARTALPPQATVLVASKGDAELLKLEGCKGWHFPQRDDGVYAGYYPADSAAAIAHLELLREKGGQYLVFPASAFWCLVHYKEFKGHLVSRYRAIWREDSCLMFSLETQNSKPTADGEQRQYQEFLRQIRELVDAVLPADAKVLVVSKGDEELLSLNGRTAWHFLQAAGGVYAGHHPADSAAAISHLEAMRQQGAQFLLLPGTAFWWLEHYGQFAQHLQRRYSFIVRQKYLCAIVALQENHAAAEAQDRAAGHPRRRAARRRAKSQERP